MIIFSIFTFIIFLFNLVFSFYIYRLDPKEKSHILYFILSLFISLMVYSENVLYSKSNYYTIYFWIKISFLWPIILALFLDFALFYSKKKVSIFTEILFFIPPLIFSFLEFNQIVYKVSFNFKSYGWSPVYEQFSSVLLLIEIVVLAFYWVYGILIILNYSKKFKSIRYKYFNILFLIGILIPFLYILIINILKILFKFSTPHVTFTFTAIGNLIIGYSLLIYKERSRSLNFFYDNLIRSLNNLLVIVEDSIIVYANEYTLNELKTTADELIGQKIYQIIPVKDFNKIYEQLKPLKSNEILKNQESSLIDKDGNIHYISGNITKVYDSLTKRFAYLIVGSDVTSLKKIQFELKKAKEMVEIANISKKSFINNLHHEIRTPLNSIIGFSELLMMDSKNKSIMKELKIINKSGSILVEYFNNLIEIVNIEYNKIYNEYFNLEKFINEIKDIYDFIAKERNIVFSVFIDNDVPIYLTGDRLKLKQILNLILNNSFKFIHSEPEVKLSILKKRENNSEIIISFIVEDNGIGIDKNKLDKIFNPFEQEEHYLTKSHSGMGLGLFIVKKLLNLINGSIKVESKKFVGTKVIIDIPFKKSI